MNYEDLSDFVKNRMRMSHIYQPVMLMTLLRNQGKCSQTDIARALLEYDQSQIEYYTHITNNMVGKVLRSHHLVEKNKDEYNLLGFENLSFAEVEGLIGLCNSKLTEYIEKRGDRIWEHRRISTGYVSGTVSYEVLKRAKFHCDLCGISADERALEADHIIPRNKGGSDEISNLQALCYICNSRKRDRDDTDLRAERESYQRRLQGCVFCEIDNNRIIAQNELAYVIRDAYPVTELHSLVIPKRHVESYFEIGSAEINACNRLLCEVKQKIESADTTVTGFNIGINNGESAGQTIFHCHIHLIPRRDGDIENPRGGVRGVIPNRMNY